MPDSIESPRRAPRRIHLATAADADDAELRGRAYPVRFGDVWSAAVAVVASLGGWTLESSNPARGEIEAGVCGRLWKRPHEVSVIVSLDEMGLTRVDLVVSPVGRRLGRGLARRRAARFLRALDRRLSG